MKSALHVFFLGAIAFSLTLAAQAQTTITQWTFQTGFTATSPEPSTGTGTAGVFGSMTGETNATGSATGCAQQSGTNAWQIGTANPGSTNESSGVQFLVSTVGFKNIIFAYDHRFSNTATRTVRIQYTLDGGVNWNNLDVSSSNYSNDCTGRGGIDNGRIDVSSPVGNNTGDSWSRRTINFKAITGANNNPNFGIRIAAAHYSNTGEFRQANNAAAVATAGTWRLDNVTFTGTPLPSICITEYMYSGAPGEFIEFTNIGSTAVDMTNWSFDDDSQTPGTQSLSAFGVVQPGESVILTEATAATFRNAWGLCDNVKVIGGLTANLGRNDEINLYDADDNLVDRLTYGDQNFPGTIRTQDKSGWVSAAGLGANAPAEWTLSTVGDAEDSYANNSSVIGSPGKSTRATVSYDPCPVVPPTCDISVTSLTVTDETCNFEFDGTITVVASIANMPKAGESIESITAELEYSIDGETFQLDGLFENLGAGCYVITVRSTEDPDCFILVNALVRNASPTAVLQAKELDITFVSQLSVNGTEVVAHDPVTQRLFSVNIVNSRVDIIDFLDPAAPSVIGNIDLTGLGEANSIAIKNGIVAIAVAAPTQTDPGRVFFADTDGNLLSPVGGVTVGALPDMIVFTPDGTKVLTANEGEPNASYTIDPEGSVSIIDISGGTANATVTNATFTAFNAQEAALKAAGVRIFGPNATVAQDLEPEYIAISDDGATAYVTLQENNALAIVDIATAMVTAIKPLGYKDHGDPNNAFDASDRDVDGTSGGGGKINIQTWKVKGMYQPDAIASYAIGGQTFMVTANEGDARNYQGFSEEIRVGAGGYILDPKRFPNAADLKLAQNLGRLRVTNATGDLDGDGDFDEIYVYGARSFSIWDDAGNLVYDSGDDFERILATQDPSRFNANSTANSFDERSDDKGAEPEAVTVTTVNGHTYAFIGLERVGGFMVYNITNPQAPYFVLYVPAYTGDFAPEDIKIIEAADSPNGNTLIVVANEVSNTITTYQINPPADCPEGVELMANPHGGSNNFGYVDPAWKITANSTATGAALLNADQANAALDLSGLQSGGTIKLSYLISDLNGCVEVFSFVIEVDDPCPLVEIKGSITWEANGSGVNNVTVDVTGDDTGSDVSDIDGNYAVALSNSGMFTITPSKPHANFAELTNGVDAADVLRIQQHVTNAMPLTSPYKRVAADINCNNLISSQDAAILSQALKMNPAAINLFKKSWRFVPEDYVFPNPAQPWGFPEEIETPFVDELLEDQNFIGIKIGDVNGSGNPALKSDRVLLYTAQDRYLRAGRTIEVDVWAANFTELAALQFGLGFDPAALAFEGLSAVPGSPIQTSDFGLDHVAKGEIRAVWTNLAPQSAGYRTPLYRLRFRALQSGMLLSEALRFDEQVLRPAAYSVEYVSYPVEWVFLPVAALERESNDAASAPQTLISRPVPFAHTLVAGFELPGACEVQVRLLDLQGRVVSEQKAAFVEGYNEVAFRNLSALPAGVYFCELISEFGHTTVRVMKANH